MALTRKALKAMGIGEEQADQIIAMHTETVDGLKSQAEQYEEDAKKLPVVQKKLDELTAASASGEKDPYKVKYEAIKEEFESFKTGVTAKETAEKKMSAYRKLLAECKVNEKRHEAIMRIVDLDKLKLDENGNIEGAEDVKKGITTEWADFITTEEKKTSQPANPPSNNVGKDEPDYDSMSDEEYYKTINKKKE